MKAIKFISDQEIDLNQYDFLKTKVYADNLVDVIKSTEIDKVFTIGLYGSWGSGKSSIIETAKKSFDEKKDKIKFITYDAWQYSNDSFRRMFLRKLSKELNYSETDFMKHFYENESRDVDNEFKLSYSRSIYLLIGLLILLVILSFIDFEVDKKITTFSIITVLGTLVALFSGVFHQLKISVTKPYVFAPEQFEDCFKEIAIKSLKTNSLIDKLKYINNNDLTIKGLNKLVIVIDNIDRCNSDIAYQLLTDIKTFLGSQKFSIVFIIPVDDKALLKSFFSKNSNGNEHNDKEEFLRKIFNVTLRIKPYNSTDMFAFTKSICESNTLKLKNETINIIGKEYSNNQRRVIQLLNNLVVELNNFDDVFSKNNETIICCVLIIREEYPDFYDMVYKNASLLINFDDFELDELNDNIKRFIRIANNEFQETNNGILNIVLMNSNNRFKEIPIEVIDMIDTFDSIGLSSFLNETKVDDDEIYNYLCHKIDEAHDNNLKSDLSKYIQLVGIINNSKLIPDSFLFRIFEKFKSKLETIFYHNENLDILMKLVEFENTHFKKYKLKNILIKLIKNNINASDKTYKEKWLIIFNALIKNLKDDDTSNAIKDDYDAIYSDLIGIEEISDEQFRIFITKKFVQNRINEFKSNDLNDMKYTQIKNILSRHENKLFVIEAVFEKFNSLEIFKNNNEARYSYILLFNDFVEFSKNYIQNYNGKFIDLNLKTIFSDLDLFNQNDLIKNSPFLDAFKGDKDKIRFFLSVISNYYTFTNNIKVIEDYILKINSELPREVREFVVHLLNSKVDVNFYYIKIIDSYDFSDENLITLYRHFLIHSDNDFHIINNKNNSKLVESLLIDIDDDLFTNTINETFEYIINKSNGTLIFDVFNRKLLEKDYSFLKHLNLNLKKLFARNLKKNNALNIFEKEILNFCFEIDDDLLNQKVIDRLDVSDFSITALKQFLIQFMELIELNMDKKISGLIGSKIIEKYEKKYLHNNTPVMKTIKNQFNSIRAVLNIN